MLRILMCGQTEKATYRERGSDELRKRAFREGKNCPECGLEVPIANDQHGLLERDTGLLRTRVFVCKE
jgi:hypothetical protein